MVVVLLSLAFTIIFIYFMFYFFHPLFKINRYQKKELYEKYQKKNCRISLFFVISFLLLSLISIILFVNLFS